MKPYFLPDVSKLNILYFLFYNNVITIYLATIQEMNNFDEESSLDVSSPKLLNSPSVSVK